MRLRDIKKIAEQRRTKLRKLKASGLTYQEIADRLNLTRQRVFQLVKDKDK